MGRGPCYDGGIKLCLDWYLCGLPVQPYASNHYIPLGPAKVPPQQTKMVATIGGGSLVPLCKGVRQQFWERALNASPGGLDNQMLDDGALLGAMLDDGAMLDVHCKAWPLGGTEPHVCLVRPLFSALLRQQPENVPLCCFEFRQNFGRSAVKSLPERRRFKRKSCSPASP